MHNKQIQNVGVVCKRR